MVEERYLIYQLLQRHVDAKIPKRFGDDFQGLVTRVYRDVIDGHIYITVDDEHVYVLREPDVIAQDGDDILFVYGSEDDTTDDDFFEELMNTASRGGYVDSVLDSLNHEEKTIVRFNVGDAPSEVVRRRKKRRNRLFRKLHRASFGETLQAATEALAAVG